MGKARIIEIDLLRGIAMIMMITFHFMWDLQYFSLVSVSLTTGFWSIFQKLTAGTFIFLVGVSLTLSYSRTIKTKPEEYPVKYLMRGMRVFLYGLIITIFSYIWMREAFVFFGILHFIGASIVLATPFISFRYLNLVLGIATLSIGIYLKQFLFSFSWIIWLGFMHPVSTLDLYPILPWIGVVFLGLFAGNMIYPKGKRIFRPAISSIAERASRPVQFLGRHSFPLYFIHIPVMFGVAYILSMIF